MIDQETISLCDRYGITNYSINQDGTIDVDGDVNLDNLNLIKLPLRFRRVTGSFHCYQNKLTSLDGAPIEVGGYIDVDNNNLTSLDGCPKTIGGNIYCSDNEIISLAAIVNKVDGGVYCFGNNIKLTEVVGLLNRGVVGGKIFCEYSEEEVRMGVISSIIC